MENEPQIEQCEKKYTESEIRARYSSIMGEIILIFRANKLTFEQVGEVLDGLDKSLKFLKEKSLI